MVSTDNNIYQLQYSESFSGDVFMTTTSGPFVSLKHDFNKIFSSFLLNYNSCLLTVSVNTVAIFRPLPEVFKIFDFYSPDLYGVACSLGTCILASVESMENLVKYFQF